jgi:hypothetical protein
MTTHLWYRLETDADKNPYAFIDDYPVRADGEELDWSNEDGMRCTLKVGRRRMWDVALVIGGSWLFSERAKTVLMRLRIQKEMVWSPVEITYMDKTKELYWALTCGAGKGIDALDVERSEVKWGVTRKVILRIYHCVLDNKRIPDLDLFLLEEGNEWIVSAAFRDAFDAEGLTGAVFRACEVS